MVRYKGPFIHPLFKLTTPLRNAPYILGVRAVAIPLAAGNTTILKGSELSPKCFWAIGDIFRQAGLPAGCLNILYHKPSDAAEITTTLIAHPAVRKISFTGSTNVGSIIAATAGKYIKPVLLELGGKASAVVLDDADLEKAAMGCTLGSFLHVSILSLIAVHPHYPDLKLVRSNLHVHRAPCSAALYCR